MRKPRVIALLTIAMTAPAVGVATAGDFPPKVGKIAIVFNKSIGAAKLGQSYKKAILGWGEQGDCKLSPKDDFCFWDDDESLSSLRFKNGKVDSILISADPGKKGGFVREFKFDPNVGIGSTRAQVRNAFRQFPPDGKVTLGTKSDSVAKDGRSTNFIYTGDRLTAVSMFR